MALAPAQGLFYLIAVLVRRAPVWVSMSLWHMARNPLQYAWLTLLLLLASGTGILATTVGATLDRSYEERIRYSVATDVRVSGLDSYLGRRDGPGGRHVRGDSGGGIGVARAQERRTDRRDGDRARLFVPGGGYAETSTPGTGKTSPTARRLEILPILRSEDVIRPMPIPEDANRLRIWANPEGYYPLIFLWVVVQDANGRADTISMGAMESQDWNLMSAKLPDNLVRPLQLVSIQLNEPGYGATATAGQIVFDDLYAVDGRRGRVTLMEGFEGPPDWIPLTTSAIRSDEVARISDNVPLPAPARCCSHSARRRTSTCAGSTARAAADTYPPSPAARCPRPPAPGRTPGSSFGCRAAWFPLSCATSWTTSPRWTRSAEAAS